MLTIPSLEPKKQGEGSKLTEGVPRGRGHSRLGRKSFPTVRTKQPYVHNEDISIVVSVVPKG